MKSCFVAVLALGVALSGAATAAQTPPAPAPDNQPAATLADAAPLELPDTFDGAAPPRLPATVSRDPGARTTVRIVRLTAPLRVDGNLDEELYQRVTPISDFVQVEPRAGDPASERTEVWLSFDADNVYVSVHAHESAPERMVVNEMRRDSFNVFQNENFQFAFDTFYDRRNAVSFQFNPIGGRMDGQVANESTFNADWNPIWRLEVHRTADGWTAEAAVPFKSLRYRPGSGQVWGVQFRRINRWKNETSYLTALPANTGNNGHSRVSLYAAMVGLELPAGGARTLDLKPYLTSNLTSDFTATPRLRNDFGKDVGLDAKYTITQNVTADLTVNTDFAQVEAVEQQVNLTRFSLFFPEKREFFLENQGLYQFGNANQGNDTPTLFYSRRIGLDGGRPVPIRAGGRVNGQFGAYSVGVMNIQSDDVAAANVPSTNFSVLRLRRNILRRSAIGGIYTRRSVVAGGSGVGQTYGVDAAWNFFQNLSFVTYWARVDAPGVTSNNTSTRLRMEYNGDRYGMQLEHLDVDPLFNPQVGFVRRVDFTKRRAMVRFSPRPQKRFSAVRKFTYQADVEFFTNTAGQLESRERQAEFQIEFRTSDRINLQFTDAYELLPRPFDIATGVQIPSGGYGLRTFVAEFQVGQQRRASGTWWLETGPFYDGDRTAFGYRGARVRVNERLAFEPGLAINRVTLPWGDFTSTLASTRATVTLSPMMFVSGLVQFNSGSRNVSTNVRFRWEYQPGSELFVVYNEGRDTRTSGMPALQNRAIVVKINRLFRL